MNGFWVTSFLLVSSLVGSTLAAGLGDSAIGSDKVGYDLHKDMFYYSDSAVEKELGRSKYHSVKVTLAGQQPDATGRRVADAVNPFVVAQKTVTPLGSLGDRWDVKEDVHSNQYLALYQAVNGRFVVNKLRANLLRELANGVMEFLPKLDSTLDEGLGQEYIDKVRDDITFMVKDTLKSVDQQIRDAMSDNDDSSASATVAIVTKKFIVVANVGDGRVVAYDSDVETSVLTTTSISGQLFGMKKSRSVDLDPIVAIYEREPLLEDDFDDQERKKYQFLVLETPQLAESLPDNQSVTNTVLGEVKIHKLKPEGEQELFSNSAKRLIEMATGKVKFPKTLAKNDFSVLLVGLERDYSSIH